MSYRKEIARQVSKATGIKQEITKIIVSQSFKTIIDILISDRRIELRNFGTFELKDREPRIRYNISKKKACITAHTIQMTFKPSKRLKKKLNTKP